MALPLDVMDVLGKEEMLFVKGNETDIVLKKKHDLIFDDKMYNVVINTTLDCNLNCWYCYEYKIKGSHLQPEVCEAIKKNIALKYKTHPFKTLKMSFFGGEPFLCYKGVKELLDYSKAFCENNDIELIADFTTNATLVSSKRIEYLKQFRCHFQITLDGWKENHNRIKVNNGAKIDAYSKTVEALRLIN